jgi:hypothetical protein
MAIQEPTTVEAEPDLMDTTAQAEAEATDTEAAPPRSRRVRRVLGWIGTVLAGVLVCAVLATPSRLTQLTPKAFLRIPLEGLFLAALLLALGPRTRRVTAILAGVGIGLLAILNAINMGFYAVLDRAFDPVLDWPLVADAVEYVWRSNGRAAAIGGLVLAGLLVIGLLVLLALAVLRLTRLAVAHRTVTVRAVAGLVVVWTACSLVNLQLVPGVTVAANGTAKLAYSSALQIPAGIRDRQAFTQEAAVDAYRNTPGDQLLTGLRGKDVMITFVESYGKIAIEDPEFAPLMDPVLENGTQQLRAAGFGARSAFMTSSTFGGGSWFAHSTLLSGLWINNQQRYRNLLASDRLTLNKAFKRAGWRTADVEPAVSRSWPEASFYGSDQLISAQNLGYKGPTFNFSSIPDQYTLSQFQRTDRGPGHPPTFAELVLLSSHTPWTPLPHMVDWNAVGDGSIYRGMPETGVVKGGVRAAYIQSIQYTVSTLISYVLTYGGDNLVLVFLGDHQPPPVVGGGGISHDVPITIVAKDPKVLDQISGWGWQDGLKPGAHAPVWRMNDFRDRFLSTFGPR